jgi:hypothetical protein
VYRQLGERRERGDPRVAIAAGALIEAFADQRERAGMAPAHRGLDDALPARELGERDALDIVRDDRAAKRLLEAEHQLVERALRLEPLDRRVGPGRLAGGRCDLLAPRAPSLAAKSHPRAIAKHTHEPGTDRTLGGRRRLERLERGVLRQVVSGARTDESTCKCTQPRGLLAQPAELGNIHDRRMPPPDDPLVGDGSLIAAASLPHREARARRELHQRCEPDALRRALTRVQCGGAAAETRRAMR